MMGRRTFFERRTSTGIKWALFPFNMLQWRYLNYIAKYFNFIFREMTCLTMCTKSLRVIAKPPLPVDARRSKRPKFPNIWEISNHVDDKQQTSDLRWQFLNFGNERKIVFMEETGINQPSLCRFIMKGWVKRKLGKHIQIVENVILRLPLFCIKLTVQGLHSHR